MTPADRLAALRDALQTAGVDGFLVPRADEHLGEYVPPSGERLAWLTGFTGSAGLAIAHRGSTGRRRKHDLHSLRHMLHPATPIPDRHRFASGLFSIVPCMAETRCS